MDDRFLSRGKLKADYLPRKKGDWVFGCFVEFDYGDGANSYIYGYGKVIPKTVGACTGLTDKNDELIFEGDIIKHYVKNSDIINIYVVEWEKRLTKFVGRYKGDEYYGEKYAYAELHEKMIYEVIGNIHDNPELLESEVAQSGF